MFSLSSLRCVISNLVLTDLTLTLKGGTFYLLRRLCGHLKFIGSQPNLLTMNFYCETVKRFTYIIIGGGVQNNWR